MPRFRKRPVEVEAARFTGENFENVALFVGFHKDSGGEHDIQTFNRIGAYLKPTEDAEYTGELWVAANQQWIPVKSGSWIIKDELGFYPCDSEVFDKTYDLVGE